MANSLTTNKPQNSLVQPKATFSNFLTQEGVRRKINEVIGGKDGQIFITSILSSVSTNPALAECDHGTILAAAFLGAALKLSPSPQLGQYYFVPYKEKIKGTMNEYRMVAQFQLGYKGYIQLAIRSGQYKKLNVLSIKEGELVRYDPLNEEIEVNLIDDEAEREKAPTIGYYAMFEYVNGFRKTLYWSKEKMLAHADKYSQAFSLEAKSGKYPKENKVSFADFEAGKVPQDEMWKYSSFWYKDFDGMAYKTMLRQLISKWGIMSVDMMTALEKDMAVLNDKGEPNYIDAIVEEPKQIEIQPEDNTVPENSADPKPDDNDPFKKPESSTAAE